MPDDTETPPPPTTWREWLYGRKANPAPPSSGNGQVRTPSIAGGNPAYLTKALADELELMRATSPTSHNRNIQLNASAYNLGQLVGGGELNQTDVEIALTEAARSVGLPDDEIAKTLRSGLSKGIQQPRTAPAPFTVVSSGTVLEPGRPAPVLSAEETFWTATPVLAHIKQFAIARMCSPWAVLGVCLLRMLATIPPHVVLPATIGRVGSLNSFVALVAPSSGGKGSAEGAAEDAIDYLDHEIYAVNLGSGEGITHQYAHPAAKAVPGTDGLIRDRSSVLFSVAEVDTLTALSLRQGATILSQLRGAWFAEALGFANADRQRRVLLKKHSYRFGLVVGVQPEKARPLLRDAPGGTPQRFLWLPATYPHLPNRPGETPPQYVLDRQIFKAGANGFHILTIPDSVQTLIWANHAARNRGEGDVLDGHALFAQEKIAQALCFLDGRRTMTEGDWQLAGTVMSVSNITRAGIEATLKQEQAADETRRAERLAQQQVVIAERVDDHAVQRVGQVIMRKLERAEGEGWVPRRMVREALGRTKDKRHLDAALAALITSQLVEERPTPSGQTGTEYRKRR